MDMSPRNRRYVLVAAVAAVVVLAAGAFFLQGQKLLPSEQPQQEQNQTDEFEQYASAEEESGTTKTEGVTIAQEIKINEFGVSPARAVIEVGEGVRWVNQKDVPVRLEFGNTPQTPTIQPGGTLEMRFRAVTYYEVYNANTDSKITGGSIATE